MTDHDAKMAAQSRLRERIEAAGGHPAMGDTYEHYKGGFYVISMIGIKEDTMEPMIGYYSLTYYTYSFRTLDNWGESVEVGGEMVPRFRLVNAEAYS
jgi:hypothetical protein